jgi:mannosyl-glycoprotein endo-beta-N-acetylglucosaminidase
MKKTTKFLVSASLLGLLVLSGCAKTEEQTATEPAVTPTINVEEGAPAEDVTTEDATDEAATDENVVDEVTTDENAVDEAVTDQEATDEVPTGEVNE